MNIAVIITTNEAETNINAFRFANLCLKNGDSVKVFLIGKGVEAEQAEGGKFDVKEQMKAFTTSHGRIFACGTCLKIRDSDGSELCPISTMNDLYEIVREADKVVSF